MKMKNNSDNKNRPTLRRSQTITTFGVGAIADLPDASAMICDIDKWGTVGCVMLSDPRLEEKLAVSHFLMPPDTDVSSDGIKAVRFPRWMRCRKCQALRHLEDWRRRSLQNNPTKDFDSKPRCDICFIPLIPSRFVVACRKGHIDDFPFVEWAHGGGEVCASPSLQYKESGNSTSLSGILIKCVCGKMKDMGGSFSKETVERIAQHCKGAMPWALKWSSPCNEKLVTLQRGGTNVHFPILKSSILIPPHTSQNIKTIIKTTKAWSLYETQNNVELEPLLPKLIAGETGLEENDVKAAIEEMTGDAPIKPPIDKSEEDYRYEEYRAFLGDYDKDKDFDERDFLITAQDASAYDLEYFSSVVLVKKLREIRVQTGFSRIRPPQRHSEDGSDIPLEEQTEIMSVTQKRHPRWLPGYEVRGEGIFLEIDPKALQKWAASRLVKEHYKLLLERSRRHPDSFGIVERLTPEFIAIHTLAHLLIRQLSFECGYSSSALRERIYCSSDQGKRPMAGLLIYTAEGDSDGTMGGLVRQGEKDLLPDTFRRALDQAQWCSSDPLCIESDGQGYQALNLAACHACVMVPETSCELLNRYLDRAALVGTISVPEVSLFANLLSRK